MKKLNILVLLLVWFSFQISWSEEIPQNYHLLKETAALKSITSSFAEKIGINQKYELYLRPWGNYPDFFETEPFYAENDDYSEDLDELALHETQGIANINGEYWLLSKNGWIDTFKVDNDDLLSESNKVTNISLDDDKCGDIDFFENKLYFPIKKKIYVYKWNSITKKFTEEQHYPIEDDSFGVAVHPHSRNIFYRTNFLMSKLYGKKLSNWECRKTISFINKENSNPIEHERISDTHWTQGMAFSPNGRFLFYVHDDKHDEDSEYTGIYVYYIDAENFEKLMDSSCKEKDNITAKLVNFINIKYDPDYGETRVEELEGVDVGSIGGYDLRILILHNEAILSGQEYHSILHFATGDYDGDGIKDIYDNCPFDWNWKQEDWNEDGIGDICQDYDKDGIKDSEDNCPKHSNPYQDDWDGEEDFCDDIDGDNWPNEKDPCPYHYNTKTCDGEDCRFSKRPSDCCLEARKECDMDGDGRWDEELYNESYPDFYDDYAFNVGAVWTKGGARCEKIGEESSKTLTLWYESCDVGYSLTIDNRTAYFSNMKNTDAKMSSYYCYCGWGEEHINCDDEENGTCGTDHAHPGEAWNYTEGKPTWMPLYSNGNYKDKNFADIVVESERSQKTKIQQSFFYKTWSYSQDNWLKSQITGEKNPENMSDKDFFATLPYAETDEEKKMVIMFGNYPKMKISHGAVFSNKNNYIRGGDQADYEINKSFFSNSEEYQRHIAGNNEELNLAKKSKDVDLIIENKIFIHGYFNLPGFGKWYWEMLRDYIGEKPWWKEDLPFARQFEDIIKESIYESISRPSLFSRVSYNGEEIKIKAVQYPENYNQIFAYAVQDGIYYQENDEFKIAFSDENGIFENAKTVHNGFEMRSAAVAVKGTGIYMAAGMTVTPSSRHRNQTSDNSAEEKPVRNRRFARIYFINGEPVMEELAELPWTPEYITLFKMNDRIHAMMMNEQGKTSVLKYSSDNNSWETLDVFEFEETFSLNNTFVKNDKLYFTAPNSDEKTALFSWDESNSFAEIAHIDSVYDSFIKPFEFGGKIILADLKDISGKSVDSWQLNETIFEKEKMSLDKPKFAQNFCLNETDNSIFPGITNVYGECVKVENYDFDEVTFPDYKLSVAGYKNSLYLGGLTGIRRVEIGKNGEITKKEMIYSGESNNLAVYGNTLYAANYSEIDIFEIADDGSISRKSSVKTNNCQNIRIENGNLFAAENKRVRIFDLSDPLAPKLLKTITLNGKAEDLEIVENRLFVYENLNGLLTRKGKVSVFDVSNISSPHKNSEFSQYCNDPEMQKSKNSVYLGCKNGSFKVTDSGLQKINGSKNYLREGYVFDGILYQVFSGTLHKSSMESKEIEDDGWL